MRVEIGLIKSYVLTLLSWWCLNYFNSILNAKLTTENTKLTIANKIFIWCRYHIVYYHIHLRYFKYHNRFQLNPFIGFFVILCTFSLTLLYENYIGLKRNSLLDVILLSFCAKIDYKMHVSTFSANVHSGLHKSCRYIKTKTENHRYFRLKSDGCKLFLSASSPQGEFLEFLNWCKF